MLFTEPVPIAEGDPNAAFYYNSYLQELFQKARYLRLTQGATILHNHKAGNLNGKWLVFTSNSVADAEDTIAHDLKRIPLIYLAGIPDKSARLYLGTTAATSTNVYLKSSTATTAWKVMIA